MININIDDNENDIHGDDHHDKMSASRLMNSIIEIMCYEIIMMSSSLESKSNPPPISTDAIDSDTVDSNTERRSMIKTIKAVWKKRMYKINVELKYLQEKVTIDVKCPKSQKRQTKYGRLFCYYEIINYFKSMDSIVQDVIYMDTSTSASVNTSKSMTERNLQKQQCKWDELAKSLENLHDLFMNPNSNILKVPRFYNESGNESEIENDNNYDDDNNHDICDRNIDTNIQSKMESFAKEYQTVKRKLSIQHCFQYIRNEVFHCDEDNNEHNNDENNNEHVHHVVDSNCVESFHQCINDGRFENNQKIVNILMSLLDTKTTIPKNQSKSKNDNNKNSKCLMKLKSKKDIQHIIQQNDKWFDCVLLLQEMELLVQNWCRVCLSLPEFHPQKYVYYSLHQLGHQQHGSGIISSDRGIIDSNLGKPMIMTMNEQEERRRNFKNNDKDDDVDDDETVGDNDDGDNDINNSDKIEKRKMKEKTRKLDAITHLVAKRRRLKQNVQDPLEDIILKASAVRKDVNIIIGKTKTGKGRKDDASVTDDFFSADSSFEGESHSPNAKSCNIPKKSAAIIQDDIDNNTDKVEHNKEEGKPKDDIDTSDSDDMDLPSKIHKLRTPAAPPSGIGKRDDSKLYGKLYGKPRKGIKLKFTESSQSQSADDQLWGDSPPKEKRRRKKYSAEEKDAIKEGYKLFGREWSRIRSKYDILRERDPVSIKDCFRNMEKRGEIF